MRQKYIAALLTALVVCQIGAIWAVYTAAIWLHRETRQTRLSDERLWVHFEISASEFESALLDYSELELNGERYDIVHTTAEGDKVFITAVADQTEERMIQTLNDLQRNESGWSKMSKLTCSFGLAIFIPASVFQFTLFQYQQSACFIVFQDTTFSAGVKKKQYRPPLL